MQLVVSFQKHIQDSFNKAGLLVSRLHITAPEPLGNETVPDQVVAMIGQAPTWQAYRYAVSNSRDLVLLWKQEAIQLVPSVADC